MFTGLVQEVGVLRDSVSLGKAVRLKFQARDTAIGLRLGDSVACNGVCLTVEELFPDGFFASAVPETLTRTTLSSLRKGGAVNLEPALKVGSPLGGHFVQGHVDGTAEAEEIEDISSDGGRELTVRIPAGFSRYCVEKGSFALHGVSLTIAGVQGDRVRFALVPHTLAHTNLGQVKVGDSLNFEVDLLGKYVERLLSQPGSSGGGSVSRTVAVGRFAQSALESSQLEKWGYGV